MSDESLDGCLREDVYEDGMCGPFSPWWPAVQHTVTDYELFARTGVHLEGVALEIAQGLAESFEGNWVALVQSAEVLAADSAPGRQGASGSGPRGFPHSSSG